MMVGYVREKPLSHGEVITWCVGVEVLNALGGCVWRAGPSQQRWHEKLTVAVVAMSKDGRVGAASTLGPHNVHRGRPAFPFVVRGSWCVGWVWQVDRLHPAGGRCRSEGLWT